MTPDHIKEAAKILLDWQDSLDDPFAQAIPIAQAEEAGRKAFAMGQCREAAHRAFIRRWLESISRDNAKMLKMMSEKP